MPASATALPHPKANFTLVPRISAETNPINVKERPNILLVSASC